MNFTTRTGPPHSFGWLKRPEYDTEYGLAWERPDGSLFLLARNQTNVTCHQSVGLAPLRVRDTSDQSPRPAGK